MHTLVSAKGACAQAIAKVAGGPSLPAFPNIGDIAVSAGNKKLSCSHVIHTTCCHWNGGTGEVVGINSFMFKGFPSRRVKSSDIRRGKTK